MAAHTAPYRCATVKLAPRFLIGPRWHIALALWNERVAARDAIAVELHAQLAALCRLHEDHADACSLACVGRALETSSRIERFFWLTAAADHIRAADPQLVGRLYRTATRRICAARSVPSPQRLDAIRFLADEIHPLC